jgi:signal peptidase I
MARNLGNILSTIAFAVLFLLCLAFAAVRVSGLSTFVVTGGSMEPSIQKGSLVLVQPVSPSEVQVGDVITFQHFDQMTTHRVTSISTTSVGGLAFTTKGDANVIADPDDKTFAAQVGIVRAGLPVAGYVVASLQSYWRLLLTLLAAVIFFACASVLLLRKEPSPAASPKPVKLGRLQPVRVAVDPDEAWRAHVAWLESSRRRAAMAA